MSESKSVFFRLLPLAILVIALIAFFSLGLHNYITLEQLKENREWLLQLADEYGVIAAVAYGCLYCLLTAVSFPGGLVLTITSGFLFGLWIGTAVVVLGATAGAVIIFLAVRFGIGSGLQKKAGPSIKKMEAGFKENAFSYLLILRLVPIFPFWLVNIVPAIFRVGTGTYTLATLIGIIPGSFVYVTVGNGIGEIFDSGQEPDLSIITNPEILLPIIGLCLLALLQIVYKKIKQNKSMSIDTK